MPTAASARPTRWIHRSRSPSTTRTGAFGLAVVLASLYPGVTVLLARVVLGERLRWIQRVGLALAAVGIVLVAA